MSAAEGDIVSEFKAFVIEHTRDPDELPSAKHRALMACLVIPEPIQKWMVEAGVVQPLLESIEKTIIAAEEHARQSVSRAAPELLEALLGLKAVIEGEMARSSYEDSVDYNNACAAITKATGGA